MANLKSSGGMKTPTIRCMTISGSGIRVVGSDMASRPGTSHGWDVGRRETWLERSYLANGEHKNLISNIY